MLCGRAITPYSSPNAHAFSPFAAPVRIVLRAGGGNATKNARNCQAWVAMAALAVNDRPTYVRIMRARDYDGEFELKFHDHQNAVALARKTPSRDGAACMGTPVTRCATFVPRGRQGEPPKQCEACRGWSIDHKEKLKEQESSAWGHELEVQFR